jgi:hypothetical protein
MLVCGHNPLSASCRLARPRCMPAALVDWASCWCAFAGVKVAAPGSMLCGGGACPAGWRCFDGFNCCPEDVQICGGTCCNNNRVCLQNQCVAAGSTPCGTAVCSPGQQCSNNVCCDASRVVCGSRCCDQGQQCLLGQCAAAGATACGANICSASQQCVQGICCGLGETNCGGRCCGLTNTCLLGRYCVPQGGHVAFVVAVMACFTLHAARCSASTTHMLNRTEQSFQENKQDGAKSCLPLYTCAHTHTCTKTNCGGRCCGLTNTCLLGRYCVPQGAQQGTACRCQQLLCVSVVQEDKRIVIVEMGRQQARANRLHSLVSSIAAMLLLMQAAACAKAGCACSLSSVLVAQHAATRDSKPAVARAATMHACRTAVYSLAARFVVPMCAMQTVSASTTRWGARKGSNIAHTNHTPHSRRHSRHACSCCCLLG